MGAPIGNQNRTTHGLRSGGGRHGLTIGRSPAGSPYLGRLLAQFRRGLEQAVIVAKGTVDRADAGLIDRAVHWHRHSLLARRWLEREGEKLDPEQRLRFSYAVADACDRREASIGRLGIGSVDGTAHGDVWAQFDAQRAAQRTQDIMADSEAAEPDDAPDGPTSDQEATS